MVAQELEPTVTEVYFAGGAAQHERPNKALHRTLANVAKIHDYNHVGRVAEDVLPSWSAGELGRWRGCGCLPVTETYSTAFLNPGPRPTCRAGWLGIARGMRADLAFTSATCAQGLGLGGSASSRA